MTDHDYHEQARDLLADALDYNTPPAKLIDSAHVYALLAVADAIRDSAPKDEGWCFNESPVHPAVLADLMPPQPIPATPRDDETAQQGQDGETDGDDFPCCTGGQRAADEVVIKRYAADNMLERAEKAEAERDMWKRNAEHQEHRVNQLVAKEGPIAEAMTRATKAEAERDEWRTEYEAAEEYAAKIRAERDEAANFLIQYRDERDAILEELREALRTERCGVMSTAETRNIIVRHTPKP